MRTTFNLDGNRKALVAAIAEITGEKAEYMRMPTCAYKIGDITVEKDGTVDGDITEILGELKTRGFEPRQERLSIAVSIPMGSGRMLRNLVNLIYVRGELINRALGTDFRVAKTVVDAIKHTEDASEIVQKVKEGGVNGLAFEGDAITFAALPETATEEQVRTYLALASMMGKQAREMYRINTVRTPLENEKYEMRIWLLRLGMVGEDYKEARRVLLNNLSGHPAYRTKEAEESARSKRKEARKMKETQP